MESTQLIGVIAGICTGISLVPQLIKIKKERKANGTSTGMLVILLAGLIGWIIYGFLRNDYPILITNSFSLITNIWIMILSAKYQRSGRSIHSDTVMY